VCGTADNAWINVYQEGPSPAGPPGSVNDYGRDIAATPDGDFIIVSHMINQPRILRITPTGKKVWDRFHPQPMITYVESIAIRDDGVVYIGGYQENSQGTLWIARIDPTNGDLVWQKVHDINGQSLRSLKIAPNQTIRYGAGNGQVGALDPLGDPIFGSAFSMQGTPLTHEIAVLSNTTLFGAGRSGTSPSSTAFVARQDHPDNPWVHYITKDGATGQATGLTLVDDKHLVAVGTWSEADGVVTLWARAVDLDGKALWTYETAGFTGSAAWGVAALSNGDLAVVGSLRTGPSDPDPANGWVARLGSNGTEKWTKTFGGLLKDDFRRAAATPDGGLIAIGGTANEANTWAARLDLSGNTECP